MPMMKLQVNFLSACGSFEEVLICLRQKIVSDTAKNSLRLFLQNRLRQNLKSCLSQKSCCLRQQKSYLIDNFFTK